MKIRSYEHLFGTESDLRGKDFVQVHHNLSELENLLVAGDVFTKDRLAELATNLASTDQVSFKTKANLILIKNLKQQAVFLNATYFHLDKIARSGGRLTPGAEWLLDNNHVVSDHIFSLRSQLSAKFYRNLVRINSGNFENFPRIYKLAYYYLAHTDGTVDLDYAHSFVSAYQQQQVLNINELWAFPLMLRLVSIQRLQLLMAINLEIGQEQKLADSIIEQVLSDESCSGTELLQRQIAVFSRNSNFIKLAALPLIRQLRLKGSAALLCIQWLEEKLKELGEDVFEQSLTTQKLQAANQIAIGNSITALNSIAAGDWKEWFEVLSRVDATLRQDPANVFALSDFETRDRCRKTIERLALQSGLSELNVAQLAIEFECNDDDLGICLNNSNRSVTYTLLDDGLLEFESSINYKSTVYERLRIGIKTNAAFIYFAGVTLLLVVAFLYLFSKGIFHFSPLGIIFILLSLFPVSELALRATQYIMSRIIPPAVLAKYDFDEGLPDSCKTVVVINVVLDSKEAIQRAINNLEVRYLANTDKNLFFALLADFAPAASEQLTHDQELLDFAQQAIKLLNDKHSSSNATFYVLFRKRVWVECESQYLGWERKRGKLSEFNRLLLRQTETTFINPEIVQAALTDCRYVITLDADTELPPGSARKLVATIAHPLNQPVFDHNNIVKKGFSVIQPAVKTSLAGAQKSSFSALMAGADIGLDPYNSRVSETYQDLFDHGLYLGKGIYDVKAFEKALTARVPEQTLLSHDLFEGLFSGVGLATDINVIDDNPARYNAYAKRMQRWIRGDWQLMPWLGSKVPDLDRKKVKNSLNFLSRWKIFDNMRRSLVVPALLIMFIYSALAFSTQKFALVISIIAAIYFWPLITGVLGLIFGFDYRYSIRVYLYGGIVKLYIGIKQTLLSLAVMVNESLLIVVAISTTIWRVLISHKNLLEWQTSEQAERTLQQTPLSYIKSFLPSISIVLLLIFCVTKYNPDNLPILLPLAVLWLLAPMLVSWLSNQTPSKSANLNPEDEAYLREVAYETWQFFDQHLNADDHYLMPDNLQIIPTKLVARRTSPTNIGLSILSVISAYDLGFISLNKKINKLLSICETLASLETYRGHLFNWYSTENKQALHPRYISFVDSGNYIAFIMAAKAAFEKIEHRELLPEHCIAHLKVSITKNEKTLSEAQIDFAEIKRLVQQPFKKVGEFDHTVRIVSQATQLANKVEQYMSEQASKKRSRTNKLDNLLTELQSIAGLNDLFCWYEPWQQLFDIQLKSLSTDSGISNRTFTTIQSTLAGKLPTLSFLSKLSKRLTAIKIENFGVEHKELIDNWQSSLSKSSIALAKLIENVSKVREYFTQTISAVDFKFLFDSKKQLFFIGYHVSDARYDNARYDLLASEARLGSIAAIALGQIQPKHWFTMRRAFARSFGREVLLSWSGTMFEYLMPLLLAKDYPGTLLYGASRAAVRAQITYARKRNVPWGVSESGYSGVDFHKNYQYKAFGVPGLGLKRGLVEDLVISPYSAGLALLVDPYSAVSNLRKLEEYQARGQFGFYEAIDFTPERLSQEESFHVVKSFLAHHQGMILVAVNNLLSDGIFQKRFHNTPQVKAYDSLLHEKIPDKIRTIQPHQAEISNLASFIEEERARKTEIFYTPHTAIPRTRLISNGSYSVLIDNSGSGHSFINGDTSVNRWKEDASINNLGFYIYVKDKVSDRFWSTAYQPALVEPDNYQVRYHPERIEFERLDQGIKTLTEVLVAPMHNIEIRKVTVSNTTLQHRTIELTSYAEIALTKMAADRAHPAFAKMFIESEFVQDQDAIIFKRRARSDHDRQLFAFHKLTVPVCWSPTRYETSRFEFIGRGLNASNPKALKRELTGSIGMVLDPVMALRTDLELEPAAKAEAYFILGVANSMDECRELIATYHDLHTIEHAIGLAWSQSQVELRHQLFTIAQTLNFQHLANCILFNSPQMRGPAEAVITNRLGQSGFWRFGISGDLPIVTVRLNEPAQIKLAYELLLAHEYLRLRGLNFDLLLLNEYPGGYFQDFQNDLEVLIRTSSFTHVVDRPGGVYVRNRGHLSEQELNLILAFSRVVLEGRKGSLANQLQIDSSSVPIINNKKGLFSYLADHDEHYNNYQPPELSGQFNNSYGNFSQEGKAYELQVNADKLPPLPWSNVIANPNFGFLVTESGAGYTWSGNSRENRITPWSNDPVSDPLSEVIYIRDSDTGAYWSATPQPVENKGSFQVKHAFGYSQFATQIKGIYSKLTISGSHSENVKWYALELTNGDYVARQLELYFYVEWVLGINRELSYRMHHVKFDKLGNNLCAVNYYNNEFAGRAAFIGSNLVIQEFTANRLEFIGRNRNLAAPYYLEKKVVPSLANLIRTSKSSQELSGEVGALLDDCGVIKVAVELEPRETKSILFYVAEVENSEQVTNKAKSYANTKFQQESFEKSTSFWTQTISALQVKTPENSFDLLVNGWLTYQNLSCRMWGRSAFYQSGGAYGFRDQLQDALAVLYYKPEITRQQILLHAARQFIEGDVQHWWHPPTGRGVRTRISDDYLWLPHVVEHYIKVTGDSNIFDELCGFIEGPILEPTQHEIYIVPKEADHKGTIYEHCIIALDRCLEFGPHGLPLMGGGDWNDGMNEVGLNGKGESVWLAWFIYDLLKKFVPIVAARGDKYRADLFAQKAEQLLQAVEQHAWDGKWYVRAFFDNGQPIGSSQNEECRIDAIAQAWSVISGAASKERQELALTSVYKELVNTDSGIISLLTPAFNKSKPSPGYIQGYLPGIRENGGQYTHAAAWVIMATALLGKGQKALELFSMVNPINHTRSRESVEKYKGEPYVLCGDVYSGNSFPGRAGWSWYTGSAGWLYRVAIEYILGLKIVNQILTVNPCVPSTWDRFSISYRYKSTTVNIKVDNTKAVESGVIDFLIDGQQSAMQHLDLAQISDSTSSIDIQVIMG